MIALIGYLYPNLPQPLSTDIWNPENSHSFNHEMDLKARLAGRHLVSTGVFPSICRRIS